jgi:hypothetical protein
VYRLDVFQFVTFDTYAKKKNGAVGEKTWEANSCKKKKLSYIDWM